jgi:DNA repair protein RadC
VVGRAEHRAVIECSSLSTGMPASVVSVGGVSCGFVTASSSVRRVTRVVREATELVGLPLLDHLIVTDSAYYSFREAEGWEE